MEDASGRQLEFAYRVRIEHLLVSTIHRYEGRPSDGPRAAVGPEDFERVSVRAHLGIAGDRHFGKAAHRTASVTIMAVESVEHVRAPSVSTAHSTRSTHAATS